MKRSCCNPPHPLIRGGTSGPERSPPALSPSTVPLDDRGLADLLVWCLDYSRLLAFREVPAGKDEIVVGGAWEPIVRADASVLLSEITRFAIAAQRDSFREISRRAHEADTGEALHGALEDLCQLALDLARQVTKWRDRAVDGLTARRVIEGAIHSEMRLAVQRIRGFDLGADDAVDSGGQSLVDPLNLDYEGLSDHEDLWGLEGIPADTTIYEGKEAGRFHLERAVERVGSLYERLHGVLSRLIQQAPRWLAESLGWPEHEPHLALLIAFLRLFRHAQARLNRLPREHLEFYYQRVLGLRRRPAEPDRVHLVFTLAKQVVEARVLEAGTLFKGGKDADGIGQIYRLEEDVSLSRAAVSDIRALYIARNGVTSFHVSPQATTRDGNGADFEEGEEARWKTFGQDATRDPPATAPGLAIASPLLFLAEGNRTITTELTVEGVVADILQSLRDALMAPENPPFTAHISTTEGWHDLARPTEVSVDSSKVIQIKYVLPTGAPPAVARIDDKTPAHEYPTPYPVFRLVSSGELGKELYEGLSELELKQVRLTVGVVGLYGLYLENDAGALQSGKPAPPFGSTPVEGSSLYLGHFELFCKDLQSAEVSIEWLDKPTPLAAHYSGYPETPTESQFKVSVDALDTRHPQRWISLEKETELFPDESIGIDAEDDGQRRNLNLEAFTSRPVDSVGGFLRLSLLRDFLHAEFQSTYTQAVLALARSEQAPSTGETMRLRIRKTVATTSAVMAEDQKMPSPLPNAPWTPMAASISLNYTAGTSFTPGEKPGDSDEKRPGERLFHLHPFGFEEIRKTSPATPSPTLLPKYTVKERVPAGLGETAEETRAMVGALYLGISGLSDAARNLSVLFQVAEGSADPLVPEPPTVTWSYLKDNRWENFSQSEVLTERTEGFLRSGTITLALPSVKNLNHTLMPKDLYWIRAAVSGNPDGTCDLYGIHAQAGLAVFEDKDGKNAESHYEAPLVAGSIQKLVERDSEIAKIEQPYASFGARVKERDEEFYRRISERLRHKDRAIALWDYERLVLEHFPAVYRVKCLPHTDGTCELAPGHVQVVVVADVENRNEVNAFEPRASQALRDAIGDMLKSRVSPWVVEHLDVVNPRYERISTELSVRFRPGYDTGVYKTKLAHAIREFLAPWAFKSGAEISFGGRIHSSTIVNFIDEQEYVDAVLDFRMFQHIPGEDTTERVPVVEAVASTAGSILVAAPTQVVLVEEGAPASVSGSQPDSWASSLPADPGSIEPSSSSAAAGPTGEVVEEDALSALDAPDAEPRDEEEAEEHVDDLFLPPALPREPFDSLAGDAWGLRREGIEHLQRLAGRTWTDHNVHDPGITILDVLCFALTDLAFRARHDKDSLERLLATPPVESGEPIPPPQFFTAREVLTSHPVTEKDFRKLLIDCEGVRNAWLEPTSESERDLFLLRVDKTIKHYPREDAHQATEDEEKIHLDGLNRIYLELEADPELGDLNDERVTASVELPEPDGSSARHRLGVHFVRGISGTLPIIGVPFRNLDTEDWSVENPFWEELLGLDLSRPPTSFNLNANETVEGNVGFDVGGGAGLLLVFRLDSGEGGFDLRERSAEVEAALRAESFECLLAVLRDYQNKVRLRREIVDAVRSRLQAHRLLCEDFLSIHGMRVEEVGICVDVELAPQADVNEVQARIEFEIARALSPDVRFFSLEELREANIPAEEIFNGPRLQHGFIDDNDLEGRGRIESLYASDLIQIIMDVPGVRAVQRLLMSNYIDDAPQTLGATWELKLAEPVGRVPRFSANKSRFLFYKGLVPFFSHAEEVHRILSELEVVARRFKQLSGDLDIAVPAAEYRDLQEYTSIQTHFPLVYGIGEEGLDSTASAVRQAQAKQLKAYLLFFDQLLVDGLAQLAHFNDLFSVNGRPGRTRYTRALELSRQVPRGEELFLNHLDYPHALAEIAEDEATFDRRRNGFLDHLLARFGERFGEYARIVRDLRDQRAGAILIRDKEAFLRSFPSIGYRRGLGFNTLVFSESDCPSEHNVGGFRRRVGALLGLRDDPDLDGRLQREEVLQTFEIYLDEDKKWRFRVVLHDAGPDKVLKDTTAEDSPAGAAEELIRLMKAGALPESCRIEAGQDKKHYLRFRGPQGDIAVSSEGYATRSEARTLCNRLVDLFERELSDPTIDSFTYWFKNETERWSFLIVVEEGLALEAAGDYEDAVSAQMAIRQTLLTLRNRRTERLKATELADGRSGISILGENNTELARSSAQYDSKPEAEKRLDRFKELIAARVGARLGLSPENFFVLEHLLLRPRRDDDQTLRIAHRDTCDEVERVDPERLDPYSFRASVVLPGEAPRFRDTVFRAFAEDTLRREAPTHVSLKICWVDHDQLLEFERAYCHWRQELARRPRNATQLSRRLEELIDILERLRSIYPQATLHDCRDPSGGSPVVLGHRSLGELKDD